MTNIVTDTPIDRRLIVTQAMLQAVGDGFLGVEETGSATVDLVLRADRLLVKIRRGDDAGS